MSRIALLVSLVALTAGCKPKIDSANGEKVLSERLAAAGFKMTVTCPKDVVIKKDEKFTCEAKGEDGEFAIDVTMTDDKGGVTWKPAGGLIDTKTVVEGHQKKHPEAKFACAKRLVLLKQIGDTTSCDVTAGDKKGKLVITLTNEDGGSDSEIKLD